MDLLRYLGIEGIKLPAFTDIHVHTRNPGFESINSSVLAALKGGITTFLAMPNTTPIMDDYEIYKNLKDLKLPIDFIQVVALTKNLKDETLVDYHKFGSRFFSNDGYGIQDDELMDKICKIAKEHNFLIMQHPEYLKYRGNFPYSKKAEYKMIERDIELSKKYDLHIHFQHISCLESIALIKDAKKDHLKITCEVTPHHLLFNESKLNDPIYKTNPPLRKLIDQEALLDAFNDETIDCLASDHAPHLDKGVSFKDAPCGMIGMETAFASIYTNLILKGKTTMERVVDAYSTKPRSILNLPPTTDYIIIDQKEINYTFDFIETASKNSPFIDSKIFGLPVAVIRNDQILYLREDYAG